LGAGGYFERNPYFENPQNAPEQISTTKSISAAQKYKTLCAACIFSDFPEFPPLFSPKNCPYLNFEGGNGFLDPKTIGIE